MTSSSVDHRFSVLCAEAEAARMAGDLPAAAFAYAIAIAMLPPEGAETQLYELRLARAACLHSAGDYGAEAEELAQLDILVAKLQNASHHVTVALRRATLLTVNGDPAAAQLLAATALAEAWAIGDPGLEAASLLAMAEAAYYLNDFSSTCARAEKSLAAFSSLGDRRGEAHARRILGLALLGLGGDALGQLRAALDLSRAIGDRAGEALTLNAIGIGTTDRAEARSVYIQGLAIAESSGDRESEAMLANNLGTVYLSLGLYGQARAFAGRAVRLARALGARDMLAAFLESLGRAYGGLGQLEHARVALREAYSLAESIGSRGTAAITLICLARAAIAEGRLDEAAADLDTASALCAATRAYADQAAALAWRSAVYLLAGDIAQACATSARAVELLEAGPGGEFPAQEVWWQRYQALSATEGVSPNAVATGEYGGCNTSYIRDSRDTHHSLEALDALARARDSMFAAIATLSDSGLRRSYLGRVGINRSIVEALASADGGLEQPTPPPVSHVSLQDQLTRLLNVTARLNDLRDVAALREIFLDELIELCGAERLLLLLGPSLEAPESMIGRGIQPGELAPLRLAVMPMLREALRRRRALTYDDPGDPQSHEPPALRPRSTIAVPLISGARTVGAFYADVRSCFGPFGAGDLDLIGLLAAQAATALENARLYAQTLRAKEELERQVAERTADLRSVNIALAERAAEAQAAYATAEAASAAKSAFLANVSHELRTPLNAVIGFTQVLQRDQGLSERQRELLGIIGRSGDHLLGLINDVLELSKIEAGRLRISPAPFDLYSTLCDLDGLFRLRADVRQLDFAVRIGPAVPRYVIGDEGRLRQVLFNLIGNALKFTHSGEICVEATAMPEGARTRVRVAVADTGEGIGPDELELLFKPFMQTESGRRLQDGTGLGLALSRQLARLMGGDITVTSTLGEGSTFVVEILLDPAAAPLEPTQMRKVVGLVTAGRRYRALVADEHWQTRRLLAEWLQEAGVEVREAADGAQALDLCLTWRPHLALLDMQLPVIDGLEAARQIKESPGGRSTVILAMDSADSMPPPGSPCYDELLPRPVRHDQLLTSVAQHMGLDLRFAEALPSSPLEPLSRADLDALPENLRSQLALAAASSDPALVAAAVARIETGWPTLGERLSALADEFQFEAIELLAASG